MEFVFAPRAVFGDKMLCCRRRLLFFEKPFYRLCMLELISHQTWHPKCCATLSVHVPVQCEVVISTQSYPDGCISQRCSVAVTRVTVGEWLCAEHWQTVLWMMQSPVDRRVLQSGLSAAQFPLPGSYAEHFWLWAFLTPNNEHLSHLYLWVLVCFFD